MPNVYVRTYNISFIVFGSMFVLWLVVSFVEVYFYLHSDKMCSSETVIYLQ